MSARPRVLLTHPILEPGSTMLVEATELTRLTSGSPAAEASLREAAEGCAGILSHLVDPIGELVLATPGLRVVANCAVGFNNIDLEAATRHGVMATHTPGVLDETTADFAFALLMAAGRRVVEADRFLRAGRYHSWEIDLMLGRDVHGATLGVVGLGRIGQEVARRARGFQMRILYTDAVAAGPELEGELGATRVELDELLTSADFVTLHVPLLPSTRHLIGERELALMKSSAVLVNTSRGPVVDEAALAAALAGGHLFAAGIDVYENEPAVHPGLIGLENVVLTPHVASASVATRARMSEVAAHNLIEGLAGRPPPNLLNPEVLPGLAHESPPGLPGPSA
ncbi:MAG: 2-hydroxyacid dehydrogenase [Candidatus Dormibacteraceae bacterium]